MVGDISVRCGDTDFALARRYEILTSIGGVGPLSPN